MIIREIKSNVSKCYPACFKPLHMSCKRLKCTYSIWVKSAPFCARQCLKPENCTSDIMKSNVPWLVATVRMSAGIPLGDTADLAVECWEVARKTRAMKRDMLAAAVWSQVSAAVQEHCAPCGGSCRGGFPLVLPRLIRSVTWVTRSKSPTSIGQRGQGSSYVFFFFLVLSNVQRPLQLFCSSSLPRKYWLWLL